MAKSTRTRIEFRAIAEAFWKRDDVRKDLHRLFEEGMTDLQISAWMNEKLARTRTGSGSVNDAYVGFMPPQGFVLTKNAVVGSRHRIFPKLKRVTKTKGKITVHIKKTEAAPAQKTPRKTKSSRPALKLKRVPAAKAATVPLPEPHAEPEAAKTEMQPEPVRTKGASKNDPIAHEFGIELPARAHASSGLDERDKAIAAIALGIWGAPDKASSFWPFAFAAMCTNRDRILRSEPTVDDYDIKEHLLRPRSGRRPRDLREALLETPAFMKKFSRNPAFVADEAQEKVRRHERQHQ